MSKLYLIALEVGLTIALMTLGGRWEIQLPGVALPLTLQSMVAILTPLIFSRRNAAGGILLYLLLAATGLPLLAGGVGGWHYFSAAGGGYLIGFYVVALTSILLKKRMKEPRFLYIFAFFIIQHLVITAVGLSWMYLSNGAAIAIHSHVSPYMPGMIVKSFVGTFIAEIYFRARTRILAKN